MSPDERLCELLRRLNEDVLDRDAVREVRAGLVDRMRHVSEEEALVHAALAWLMESLDRYQDDFEEELAKVHGASWQEERKRLWTKLGPGLTRLEAAACRSDPPERLRLLLGSLIRTWEEMRLRGRPRL